MLEHIPAFIGKKLRNVRAGHSKLAVVEICKTINPVTFQLLSPAFEDGARLPARFTADAEGQAISPPLEWSGAPSGASGMALIVEDPDAPSAAPLCHWLAWGLELVSDHLGEGEAPPMLGRNSYQKQGWLAPDPPTGHGSHEYVFQLFALSSPPDLDEGSGRSAFIKAISDRVIGVALLTGKFERPG